MKDIFESVNIRLKEIEGKVVTNAITLDGWQVRVADKLPGSRKPEETDWRSIDVGDCWAKRGESAFLRRTVEIPAAWRGARVALELSTGGEGLLRIDGEPFHGVDDNRGYILLAANARGGETFDCEIEIKTGGYWDWQSNVESGVPYILSRARIATIDHAIEQAYYDFKVVCEAAEALKNDTLKEALVRAVKDSLHEADFRNPDAAALRDGLRDASRSLWKRLAGLGFDDNPGRMFATAHSHIDLAWLWPLKETMRKVGRTYSTVAALMEEYPNYHFNCSQVPLFLFLKEQFPSVYLKIKDRIKEGRFEPVGGTWVENDCNLVSGESMVRQCLYGQRFFKEEFGIDVRVGWLPDVFGYSWAMPQIYKKAGLDYFMTSKLTANDTNRFPHNNFIWQGIDGTRIFTHIIWGTYVGMLTPAEILKHWGDYNSKLTCPEFMYAYGWGDGGGGPTREMLEYLPRLEKIPGLPKARTGRVHDYFDRIAQDATDLPVWNGELYFERHRGTYTTQAAAKRNNRLSELLYREAEMFSVAASAYSGKYPRRELGDGWRAILLNQFHDILPGSSIAEVYKDAQGQYEEILSAGESARASALATIADQADTSGGGTPVVVFNSLSWQRSGIVEAPADNAHIVVQSSDGAVVPSQIANGVIRFVAMNVPSCGYRVFHLVSGDAQRTPAFEWADRRVITPFHEVTFAADGTISGLYDKVNSREVIPPGTRANALQVFEDKSGREDAWDIHLDYQDKTWEFISGGAAELLENGPVRLVVSHKLRYNQSVVDQQIVFYAHTPRIDFVTNVDWHENQMMLKAAFPVDVHATRATYEIAFGAVERPTHWNTLWDKTKFEVVCHRWADLSEADYGVSILNDCKYGCDIHDNLMRITLLRAPVFPDPTADRGRHVFTYSLLPHSGNWHNGVVQAGSELNSPLLPVCTNAHAGALGHQHSFLSVDRPNVIVDTVKQAEEHDELIVRVYEAHGARGPVTLTLDRDIRSAVECNLLEETCAPASVSGREIHFVIKPFEIRTFKIDPLRK